MNLSPNINTPYNTNTTHKKHTTLTLQVTPDSLRIAHAHFESVIRTRDVGAVPIARNGGDDVGRAVDLANAVVLLVHNKQIALGAFPNRQGVVK